MNTDEQLESFEKTTVWLYSEKERLLKIIRTAGAKKHAAWKALLEIANRQVRHKREFKRFLEHQGNA